MQRSDIKPRPMGRARRGLFAFENSRFSDETRSRSYAKLLLSVFTSFFYGHKRFNDEVMARQDNVGRAVGRFFGGWRVFCNAGPIALRSRRGRLQWARKGERLAGTGGCLHPLSKGVGRTAFPKK